LFLNDEYQGAWADNRIHYAGSKAKLRPWLRFLSARPGLSWKLRHVDFRRYGILAIFHKGVPAAALVDSVDLVRNGLAVNLLLQPEIPCLPCLTHFPFILIKVRKDSLPGPVRRLYLSETVVPVY